MEPDLREFLRSVSGSLHKIAISFAEHAKRSHRAYFRLEFVDRVALELLARGEPEPYERAKKFWEEREAFVQKNVSWFAEEQRAADARRRPSAAEIARMIDPLYQGPFPYEENF